MSTSWRLLPSISATMAFQMALDEVLLRDYKHFSDGPVLRFYYASELSLSVGFSTRRPLSELALRDGRRVPVCRRLTGGGEVLHGKDLIFALVASRDEDPSFKSVRLSYYKIHEAVKAGLEAMALEVGFYRCDENLPRGSDCFLYPIATDLRWKGKKIAGGAQKRSLGILLHQESIQLGRIKPRPADGEVIKNLCRGFEKIFGVSLKPLDLDPDLFHKAKQLARRKYERDWREPLEEKESQPPPVSSQATVYGRA